MPIDEEPDEPSAAGGGRVLVMDIDPDVKAIVSSGYSMDPIMADYAGYGFAGVIAKPFTIPLWYIHSGTGQAAQNYLSCQGVTARHPGTWISR
jgi:transposase